MQASFLSGIWAVYGWHSLYCLIQTAVVLYGLTLTLRLLWDVFAISTYFTVSLLFWYSGLLPDLATVRDRAKTKFRKMFYGVAAFGWSGSTKHWQRHESLSLVLAGLSTPLVFLYIPLYLLTLLLPLFRDGIPPSSLHTLWQELSSRALPWCKH